MSSVACEWCSEPAQPNSRWCSTKCRARAWRANANPQDRERRRQRKNALRRNAPDQIVDLPSEEWRWVAGYEGYYKISNMGRVQSVTRVITCGPMGDGLKAGKLLNPRPSPHHLAWYASKDGVRTKKKVHVVVLETFVGPRPDELLACHNDDDPRNNKLSNLRWDTLVANAQDALRNGRHHLASRTHCNQGHPFDEENTLNQVRPETGRPYRKCRACAKDAVARHKAKKAAHGRQIAPKAGVASLERSSAA